MKESGADRLSKNILNFKNNFLIMSSAERLMIIEKYSFMQPYQKVALLQCKKYMSKAEKIKFKQVSKNVEIENEKEMT